MKRKEPELPYFVLPLNTGWDFWIAQSEYFYLAAKITKLCPELAHPAINTLICSAFVSLSEKDPEVETQAIWKWIRKKLN